VNRDAGFEQFLITSKASDARRRGATTEAYRAIRRKEERVLARLRRKKDLDIWHLLIAIWRHLRREGNAADDALMVIRVYERI
jgi:hypothetical protein